MPFACQVLCVAVVLYAVVAVDRFYWADYCTAWVYVGSVIINAAMAASIAWRGQ